MKFQTVMGEKGYKRCSSDHCVFIQRFSGDDYIMLLPYVDDILIVFCKTCDILIVGKNVSRISRLKKESCHERFGSIKVYSRHEN